MADKIRIVDINTELDLNGILNGYYVAVDSVADGTKKVNLNNLVNRSSISMDQVFDALYPVGSIYISLGSSLPSSFSGHGNWTKLVTGRCLWTAENDSDLGQELDAILPQHTHGYMKTNIVSTNCQGGQMFNSAQSPSVDNTNSLSVTGDIAIGNTLRPPSIGVTMWKRTS